MGLKNMSLIEAPSAISVTGGQPLVFAEDGQTIPNGVHLVCPNDPDYQTRRQATVKYRPPTLDAKTGVYGKDKKSISLAFPQVLSNGAVVFNTIRIEREVHPSYSATDCDYLTKLGAQLLFDADVAAFWATGALS